MLEKECRILSFASTQQGYPRSAARCIPKNHFSETSSLQCQCRWWVELSVAEGPQCKWKIWKITVVDDGRILTLVEKSPFTTVGRIQNVLQEMGVSVPKSTIKRREWRRKGAAHDTTYTTSYYGMGACGCHWNWFACIYRCWIQKRIGTDYLLRFSQMLGRCSWTMTQSILQTQP